MDEREYIRLLARTPPPAYSRYDRSSAVSTTSLVPQPVPSRRNDTLYRRALNAPLRRQRIRVERGNEVPNIAQGDVRYDKCIICIICMTVFGVLASGVIFLGLCAIPVFYCLYKANQAREVSTIDQYNYEDKACCCSIILAYIGVWFIAGWVIISGILYITIDDSN